ncbi:MAG: hypothetical protein EOO06_00335 [Chitinophagaceae bacterium]|nr:MAG: hypothetical protein EOO06_00335 [Chitinophagaceae bacterium]
MSSIINGNYQILVPISDLPYKDSDGNPISRKVEVMSLNIDFFNRIVVLQCKLNYYKSTGEEITNDFATKIINLPATELMLVPDEDEDGNNIFEDIDGEQVLVTTSFYKLLMKKLDNPLLFSEVITRYVMINTGMFS